MPEITLKPLYGIGPNLPVSLPIVLHGQPGAGGASAYQLAVAAGFEGTVAEWLASLVGHLSDTDRAAVQRALAVGRSTSDRLDQLAAVETTVAQHAQQAADDRAEANAAAGSVSAATQEMHSLSQSVEQFSVGAAVAAEVAQDAAGRATEAWTAFDRLWLGARDAPPAGPHQADALYYDMIGARLMIWSGGSWRPASEPTAARLLDLIRAVDGRGSGLDADHLRGAPGGGFPRLVFHGNWKVGAQMPSGFAYVPLTPIYDPDNRWSVTKHQYAQVSGRTYIYEHQIMWDASVRAAFSSLRVNSAFIASRPSVDDFVIYRASSQPSPDHGAAPNNYPGVYVNNATGAEVTLNSGNVLARGLNRLMIWEMEL